MSSAPRVLIVEDHAILTQSLATALRLEGFDEVEVVGEDELDDDSVLAAADRFCPHVVLLDFHLGGDRYATPLIRPLVDRGVTVLMLTASKDRTRLAECLEAGAAGLFDKSQPFDQLVEYVRDAATGRTLLQPAAREELLAALREHRRESKEAMRPFETLTEREAVVLTALMDGRNAEEIASELTVGVATVRTHIQAVLRKLGVNSQLAAVALAQRAGWREPGQGRA